VSSRISADRRHLEEEYTELRGKKEMVAQWEHQVQQIKRE
jgi:hypothetical protein